MNPITLMSRYSESSCLGQLTDMNLHTFGFLIDEIEGQEKFSAEKIRDKPKNLRSSEELYGNV